MRRKKSTAPRICSEAPMRRLFPEPSAKENLCFSVQSDYISALARKVLFPNLPAQQAKLLFSFFSVKCAISLFLHFSSFFHQRATITPEWQRFRLRSRRERTCPIHKRIRFVKTLTPIVQVFVCIGKFSKGTVRSKKTPLWLANEKCPKRHFC